MGKLTVIFVITILGVVLSKPHKQEINDIINKINQAQNSWEAGYTSLSELNKHQMKKLLGARRPQSNGQRKTVEASGSLPSQFDSRDQWPQCPSISLIKDQGYCGSCWAVSTAAAASDRLCIASNYATQYNLSAENLMACCSNCAPEGGCNGGWPDQAWSYIQQTGIVTGGDYGSDNGCQPYEIYPDPFQYSVRDYTPSCDDYCTNNNYQTTYGSDLQKGGSSYILDQDVQQIQTDLFNNGPNVACFSVYEDFQHYRTGVYIYTWGNKLGDHAVRVLGWGTENNTDYWLIANSWNTTFGLQGRFKIRRGTNECGIEDYVSGGKMNS